MVYVIHVWIYLDACSIGAKLDWLTKESPSKYHASLTNSCNIIGRNPSMVISLLANQDLTPMLMHVCLLLGEFSKSPLQDFGGCNRQCASNGRVCPIRVPRARYKPTLPYHPRDTNTSLSFLASAWMGGREVFTLNVSIVTVASQFIHVLHSLQSRDYVATPWKIE